MNIMEHHHDGWGSRSDCSLCMNPKSTLIGKKIKSFYVIGSLRNPDIVPFANKLQAKGYEAFCDWKSPGPDADDFLRDYAKARGLNYKQTLQTYAAKHIHEFDKFHLDRCDAAVL